MSSTINGSAFKSMLETDWYLNNLQNHEEITTFCSNPTPESFLLHPIDSSSSCSPSQQHFTLDPSNSQQQQQYFLPPVPRQSCFSSNPFDNGFDLGCENAFLSSQYQQNQLHVPNLIMGFCGPPEFQTTTTTTQLLPLPDNVFGNINTMGFLEGGACFDKVLRPLEVLPSLGSQPTLFQKRAMLRQQSGDRLGNLEISSFGGGKRKKRSEEGEIDDEDGGSFDVSGFNYDSDDELNLDGKVEESVEKNDGNGGSNSNANSTVTGVVGDHKGKKKGMPAKNLMAERRRRKKLNDRLYMLRSVVPKISKVI